MDLSKHLNDKIAQFIQPVQITVHHEDGKKTLYLPVNRKTSRDTFVKYYVRKIDIDYWIAECLKKIRIDILDTEITNKKSKIIDPIKLISSPKSTLLAILDKLENASETEKAKDLKNIIELLEKLQNS